MTWAIRSGPNTRGWPLLPTSDVTSLGRIKAPSLATVAATSAIWSGVTKVSAWP